MAKNTNPQNSQPQLDESHLPTKFWTPNNSRPRSPMGRFLFSPKFFLSLPNLYLESRIPALYPGGFRHRATNWCVSLNCMEALWRRISGEILRPLWMFSFCLAIRARLCCRLSGRGNRKDPSPRGGHWVRHLAVHVLLGKFGDATYSL